MENQTRIYIVKKRTKPIIYLLLLMIVGSIVASGYMFLKYKSILKEKESKVKIEKPMSNVSFELEQIQRLIGKKGINEIKVDGSSIIMHLKKDISLEPLTARFENSMTVEFLPEYNLVKINKQPILEDSTKKDQLIDYITTKTPTISLEEELRERGH